MTTGLRRFWIDCIQFLRFALGRAVFVRRDINLPVNELGSDTCKWAVNLECLPSGARVYTFGVGDDISFELELAKEKSVELTLFDPTPRSNAWIATQTLPAGITFRPWGIAAFDGEADFTPPDNPEHVSFSMLHAPGKQASETDSVVAEPDNTGMGCHLPVRRLVSIMAELGDTSIDLLKLDIEGGGVQRD